MYINGKRCWLHTVSTSELTYYEPHQSRGKRLPTPLAFCLNSPAPLFTITGRPISSTNCCFMPCAMRITCAN
ncbi:MAG: hypothetical protein HS099_16150 [Ardenticatenaceae bacterium]|nr:hypothetical protein [Ardenticatenaceae bacterium]